MNNVTSKSQRAPVQGTSGLYARKVSTTGGDEPQLPAEVQSKLENILGEFSSKIDKLGQQSVKIYRSK